jgi:hypothetical protein
MIPTIVGPGSGELNVIVATELINGKEISPLIFLPYRKGKRCSA